MLIHVLSQHQDEMEQGDLELLAKMEKQWRESMELKSKLRPDQVSERSKVDHLLSNVYSLLAEMEKKYAEPEQSLLDLTDYAEMQQTFQSPASSSQTPMKFPLPASPSPSTKNKIFQLAKKAVQTLSPSPKGHQPLAQRIPFSDDPFVENLIEGVTTSKKSKTATDLNYLGDNDFQIENTKLNIINEWMTVTGKYGKDEMDLTQGLALILATPNSQIGSLDKKKITNEDRILFSEILDLGGIDQLTVKNPKYKEFYVPKDQRAKGKGKEQSGSGIYYYHDSKSLLKRLQLLIGAYEAGNGSKELRNEVLSIIDILKQDRLISDKEHRQIFDLMIKASSPALKTLKQNRHHQK